MLLPLLAACSGGGSGAPPVAATPLPTASPNVPGPAPDAVARNGAQGALLAERAVVRFVPVGGGVSAFAVRRAAGSHRSPQSNVACTNGFSEADTSSGQNFHSVLSLYYDASCTSLRQTGTFDVTLFIDTTASTGTIVSYDVAGRVTSVQTLSGSTFASGGVFVNQQSTDALSAGGAPFGRTSVLCTTSTTQCALATVTEGPLETGVVLSVPLPPNDLLPGATFTVPFGGSLSTGSAPGSIAIVQQGLTPPSLSGGGSPIAIAGSVTVTLGAAGPTAFSASVNVGSTHVDGQLSNGTTTFTVAGGAVATVNANGDGSIRYASGAVEKIVDFRITG